MKELLPVGCVIMASGLSQRFGSNKLLAPFCGELRAEQNWYASSDLSFVEYGALQLLDERFGGCRELSGFNVALFRALGIPCGIDRVVQNPHRIGSHMWTFMVDTDGRKLPYLWNY